MTLSDIVVSDVWDNATKKLFFEKLKKARDSYNKSKNCVDKALNIASPDDKHKLTEAINLVDYAIDNFSDDEFALARAYQVKGELLERYAHKYSDAFNYYTKWADLDTNLSGHEFARIRSLFRVNKLKATEKVADLYLSLKENISDLPSKDHRFWLS